MTRNIWIYIAVMAGVTFLIRVLPLTVIRKKIKNRFFNSFLYYVPYVTLAVMTFPAVVHATQSTWSGVAAMAVGVIAAYLGADLFKTAVACCVTVFLLELILVR